MPRSYKPYVPQTASEVYDKLGSMMLGAPKFENNSGYFPGKGIETEFFALNEALKLLRTKLGEERYQVLATLSDKMRAHFEADPEDQNGETTKGRQIILEMETILRSPRETSG